MAKKNLIIIIFFLSLTHQIFPDSFWNSVPSVTTKNLRNCFFINSSTGWISGDSGIMLRTTNAGTNWTVQNTNISNDIYDHFFINERLGWALAWQLDFVNNKYPGTLILKTTDGGNVWNNYLYKDTNYYYQSVFFLDSLRGFLGGIPYFLLYTSDGGVNWSILASDSISTDGFPVKNFSFLNANTGYACGGLMDLGGLIWKTTNSGLNWKPMIIGPDAMNDMFLYSEDTIFLASGDFKFGANYFRSVNKGLNWSNFGLGYFGMVTAIDFRTKFEGWMTIGYQQKFFFTTDRGVNWIKLDPPDNSAVFDICFPDSLSGWAVGANGCILKYNLLTYSEHNESIVNKTFNLEQNFPNPFNPATKINFNISEKSNVSLVIYNMLGNKIISLIDNKLFNPGSYSINFSAEIYSMASGLYFYEMTSGKSRQVKKMLLLK